MLSWSIQRLALDLKFDWNISRNSSSQKTNHIIKVSDGKFNGYGEVAANIRYGETTELIESQFETISKDLQIVDTIEKLDQLSKQHDLKHSLSFGLNSALTLLLSRKSDQSVQSYLGLEKKGSIETSFSVPILPLDQIPEFIRPLKRFKSLKIKVNQETALETVHRINKLTDQHLRIDGNEAWTNLDQLKRFVDSLSGMNIDFIEQPMPADKTEDYKTLKKYCPYPIIADESIEAEADFSKLAEQFDGINVKLMKAGSYQTAISLLKQAKEHGMKTMIGCMIETSLGISSAMHICSLADFIDLDGFLIVANDPYHYVQESNGLLSLADEIL